MRLLRTWLLVVPILALFAGKGSSHHAFSPVYDESRQVTIVGVVTEFRFVNPHALVFLDATDDAAQVVKWTVEIGGQLQLAEAGWTAASIKKGERVTVTGNPTHTGSPRMFFRQLVHSDGTVLLASGAQRVSAVEEERRQRALKRNQQK